MGRGRPPKPGTAEEKAAARRERVRNNVRALRERRRKEAAGAEEVKALSQLVSELSEESDSVAASETNEDDVISPGSSNTSIVQLNANEEPPAINDRRSPVTLLLPASPDSKSPFASALLATMRKSFLPAAVYLPAAIDSTRGKPWESDQFLWTPCAFWITSAFTKASNQDSSILKTALLAIGLILKSFEYQDAALKLAALEMYRRSLQGIRRLLEPLILNNDRPKDAVSLYLACHAAAMFELILNSDLSATMHHLRGVSQLICHLGDGSDEDGQSVAWLLLQDYRFAEMGLCLKYRYTSFSSMKRQQFERTSFGRLGLVNRTTSAHGHRSHNMLVKITDVADEISSIMVQIDSLRPFLYKATTITKIARLLDDLNLVWEGYRQLHENLILYCGTFIHEDRDADGPATGSLKFKSFDIGAAWCYNLMTQLYCLETKIDATDLLSQMKNRLGSSPSNRNESDDAEQISNPNHNHTQPHGMQELRRLHRAICVQLTRCLQYFLQTDKGITGQALAIFPLDAAICMLEVELQRLRFDLSVAETREDSSTDSTEISKKIATMEDAKGFCWKMQQRAEAFGLPSFRGAGGAYVSSLKEDAIILGSYPPTYQSA